ncbi:MAG: flagellar hook-associated protein FlgL [Myxococcota bacterium]
MMLQRQMLAGVDRTRLRLARVQEQASSGLRINRPSDDPAGSGEAAALRNRLDATAQVARNIGQADLRLRASEDALFEVTDVLIRARELAVQGANGTLDLAARRQIASEIEGLHGRLVAAGNTQSGGAHVFAGFASATVPFVASGPFVDGLPAPSVSFAGDTSEVEIEIDTGVRLRATLNGQRVFQGDADGDGSPDAGREDLFEVLADLRDALQADDQAAVAAVTARLDAAQDQISEETARLGGRSARLDAQRDTLARREVQLAARLSEVQDADSIRVLSELVREEKVLEGSLAVAARIIQPTLLDFLR